MARLPDRPKEKVMEVVQVLGDSRCRAPVEGPVEPRIIGAMGISGTSVDLLDLRDGLERIQLSFRAWHPRRVDGQIPRPPRNPSAC